MYMKNDSPRIILSALFTRPRGLCLATPVRQPGAAQGSGPSPAIIPVPREFSAEATAWFAVNAATTVRYSGGDRRRGGRDYFIEQAKHNPEIVAGGSQRRCKPRRRASHSRSRRLTSRWPTKVMRSPYRPMARASPRARPRGLFYGAVTLWQLLTCMPPQSGVAQIRAAQINDAPRFAWRGLMLDSARHYQSPEYIRVSSTGWRCTSSTCCTGTSPTTRPGVSRSRSIRGSRRWARGACRPGRRRCEDIDPKTGKPRLYGGFYTQEQARDIVAYAATRHIKVVPEIEMPGHATAAIVAYPELGVPPIANNLKAVPEEWGVFENLFNVEESTFTLPRRRHVGSHDAFSRANTSTSAATRPSSRSGRSPRASRRA